MHLLVECPIKPEVQGLQAFAFFVVTVNDEHTNLGSKESMAVKFKEGICARRIVFKALV